MADAARSPRILITYPFPIGEANGGARGAREIASSLARAGARVTLLPLSVSFLKGGVVFPRRAPDDAVEGYEFDDALRRDGVSVVRVRRHPLHWMLDALRVRRAVADMVSRERVDYVLSYFTEAALLSAWLAKRGIDHAYIATLQSYERALGHLRAWPAALVAPTMKRILVEPYRRAARLFATSEFTRRELLQFLEVDPGRVEILHLGVDSRFAALPIAKPQRIGRLLFFGRIVPSKGVEDAIRALQIATSLGCDLSLRIRGDGDHAWARGLAQRCGLADRVEVLERADDEELLHEFGQAHLAVLPSHFEAFGLAFVEAQAAGLPVVAYDAGSVPEVVQHGRTGWLAPLGDVEGLAKCLIEASASPDDTHARALAARTWVLERFDWDAVGPKILASVGVPS